jgi:hypothetical protein
MATFIDDKLCNDAVAALARLANEIGTGPLIRALCHVELRNARGNITPEEIERALGECADVWPRSVLPRGDEMATIRKLRGQLNRPLRR